MTRQEAQERKKFMDAAPSCPMEGCGANVMRPKCFWDLSPSDCPRHAVRDKYEASRSADARSSR